MTAPAPTRVLLADDHNLVRAGVRKILEAEPDLEVVAEVADGRAALEALEAKPVDVVVLDLSMPGEDGFSVLREAKGVRPGVRVLVLTMHANAEYVSRAVREGADGYLLKDSAAHELVSAIRSVTAGGVYFSPSIQEGIHRLLRRETKPGPLDALTAREREVLRMVAQGLTTKEIAHRLSISPRTVDAHRASVMRKLDLRSVALLTQLALREGLIEPP